MNRPVGPEVIAAPVDTGLRAICGVAGYYRIAADPHQIERELALTGRLSNEDDLVRAARLIGLKARVLRGIRLKRLLSIPTPAILRLNDGSFTILLARGPAGECRIVNPITKFFRELPAEKLLEEIEPLVVLVTRRFRGEGYDPKTFGFRWFLPSILRYRKPLAHVLLASLFIQIFALVTPIFFQVVVDKVLTHKGYSTLYVLVAGLVLIGLFDVVLQYLRTYALSHTPTALTSNSGSDCSDIFCAFQSPISKREPQVRRSRVCVSSRTFAHF